MEKYGAGSIVVSDYDHNWPTLFEQERTRIKKALGSFVLAIEHMGSTAVPGLPSKPIIDLLVGVPSLEEAKERCIKPIEALGYIYIPEYASWLPCELFFRKGPPGPWTHHVHLMEPLQPRREARLGFRDYLRANPEAARAYADIKRGLAASSKDNIDNIDNIEAYRTGKDIFVEETTAKARAWQHGCRRSIAAPERMKLGSSIICPWSKCEVRDVSLTGLLVGADRKRQASGLNGAFDPLRT